MLNIFFQCDFWSLYVVFGEKSIKIFCPFFDWDASLILYCICCLYISEIDPLSVTLLANTFFHSVGCLFTLWTLSFDSKYLFNSRTWRHLFASPGPNSDSWGKNAFCLTEGRCPPTAQLVTARKAGSCRTNKAAGFTSVGGGAASYGRHRCTNA